MQQSIAHFVNGIYSGIPFCCVLFFIKKMKNSKTGHIAYEVDRERGINVVDNGIGMSYPDGKINTAEYVQCDTCFLKNRVKIIKNNGILFRV